MTRRCPRCAAGLPEDAVWVCPSCDYTLRTPAVSKVGVLFMLLGLVLVGAYVMGPASIGLTSGFVPTDLANLTITYFPELIVATFGFGMFLMFVGAMFVRRERNRIAAGA